MIHSILSAYFHSDFCKENDINFTYCCFVISFRTAIFLDIIIITITLLSHCYYINWQILSKNDCKFGMVCRVMEQSFHQSQSSNQSKKECSPKEVNYHLLHQQAIYVKLDWSSGNNSMILHGVFHHPVMKRPNCHLSGKI